MPGIAAAEGFVEAFAGRASAERRDFRLRANEARVNGAIVPAELRVRLFDVRSTREGIYGARAGYWFGRNIGGAIDISTLNPDVKRQRLAATANLRFDEAVFGEPVTIAPGDRVEVDIPRITVPTTATIAALAMVRLPVARGVAPYAFAGPVWLITNSSLDGNLGMRAGGGVRVAIFGRLGLFAEYRYTHVNARAVAGRVTGSFGGTQARSGAIQVAVPVRNHSGVAGVSLRL